MKKNHSCLKIVKLKTFSIGKQNDQMKKESNRDNEFLFDFDKYSKEITYKNHIKSKNFSNSRNKFTEKPLTANIKSSFNNKRKIEIINLKQNNFIHPNSIKTTTALYTMLPKRHYEYMNQYSELQKVPTLKKPQNTKHEARAKTQTKDIKSKSEIPLTYPFSFTREKVFKSQSQRNRFEKRSLKLLELKTLIENDKKNEIFYIKEFLLSLDINNESYFEDGEYVKNFKQFLFSPELILNLSIPFKDNIIHILNGKINLQDKLIVNQNEFQKTIKGFNTKTNLKIDEMKSDKFKSDNIYLLLSNKKEEDKKEVLENLEKVIFEIKNLNTSKSNKSIAKSKYLIDDNIEETKIMNKKKKLLEYIMVYINFIKWKRYTNEFRLKEEINKLEIKI